MVDVIHIQLYYASKNTSYKTIELIGTQENLSYAEYVYHFLTNKIDELWENYKVKQLTKNNKKRSYQYGLLMGFMGKLKTPKTPQMNALIELNQYHINKISRRRFPRLRKTSNKSQGLYNTSYKQGLVDGKNIVISKALQTKKSSKISGFLCS